MNEYTDSNKIKLEITTFIVIPNIVKNPILSRLVVKKLTIINIDNINVG
jgi:hypothetical protein